MEVIATKVKPNSEDFKRNAAHNLALEAELRGADLDATGMAAASEIMRIGVGRDAGDIAFMQVFGASEINDQSVMVRRA